MLRCIQGHAFRMVGGQYETSLAQILLLFNTIASVHCMERRLFGDGICSCVLMSSGCVDSV